MSNLVKFSEYLNKVNIESSVFYNEDYVKLSVKYGEDKEFSATSQIHEGERLSNVEDRVFKEFINEVLSPEDMPFLDKIMLLFK